MFQPGWLTLSLKLGCDKLIQLEVFLPGICFESVIKGTVNHWKESQMREQKHAKCMDVFVCLSSFFCFYYKETDPLLLRLLQVVSWALEPLGRW